MHAVLGRKRKDWFKRLDTREFVQHKACQYLIVLLDIPRCHKNNRLFVSIVVTAQIIKHVAVSHVFQSQVVAYAHR